MDTIYSILTIVLLALVLIGGESRVPQDSFTPDNACAPGDAEACRSSGGEWFPKTCTCL